MSHTHNTSSKLKHKIKKKITQEMKIGNANMVGSKKRLSNRGMGGVLREQKAKLYIIRRCVMMLLCWHD
ncbi:hypothetical protein Lalb_Chr06g0170221 [Lupinus albus]|uniref:Uncharacterized protein n=1 Tax=Lupinus albus TaxID=3870 RepID=A0A6A4QEE3_LUPAL|nr:hypothetical protein Lalb_Chr06g0170221 [Lupinus albus]